MRSSTMYTAALSSTTSMSFTIFSWPDRWRSACTSLMTASITPPPSSVSPPLLIGTIFTASFEKEPTLGPASASTTKPCACKQARTQPVRRGRRARGRRRRRREAAGGSADARVGVGVGVGEVVGVVGGRGVWAAVRTPSPSVGPSCSMGICSFSMSPRSGGVGMLAVGRHSPE
eukprot:scaffold38901_cov66-Phaeocystis_antarctica.AAC.6